MLGAAGTKVAVAKESQISEQMCHLQSRITMTEELAEKLQARLESILAVIPPEAEEAAKDVPALVPLAQSIYAVVGRMDRVNDTFDSILQRLEL